MMGRLKSLGVVLAAVLALAAVVSSAASADTLQTEGGVEATLTGSQELTDKFTIVTTAGSNTCPTAAFHAPIKSGTTTVQTTKLTFPATGCLCIGIACTFNINGCNFLFHITTTGGTVDLVCPEGKELTLESAKCILHVPSQSNLAGITYSNVGTLGTSTGEVTVRFNVSTMSYSHTFLAPGIGSCTTGTGNTGQIKGSTIFTAEKVPPGTGHVGFAVG